jgi:hypothetical protein
MVGEMHSADIVDTSPLVSICTNVAAPIQGLSYGPAHERSVTQ